VRKSSGLPAILATFAQGRRYPDIGPDLRRLPAPDANFAGQSVAENLARLLPVIKEAETGNKILIIDTNTGGGFSLRDPKFWV